MPEHILVDTGPLVAILAPDDQYHKSAVAELRKIPRVFPLVTCWPVITEAAWLLRSVPRGLVRLLDMIDGRRVTLAELRDGDVPQLSAATARYSSLPAQLADTALLHLANREAINTIFSFDRKHFSVYRLANGQPLRIIPHQ